MASFQLAQPHSEREPTIVCLLLYMLSIHNNLSAGAQNITGTYVIIARLQALLNKAAYMAKQLCDSK